MSKYSDPQGQPLTEVVLTDLTGSPTVGSNVSLSTLIAGEDQANNRLVVVGIDGSGNVNKWGVNAANQLLVNTEGQKATYSAAVTAFTPVATPTDFWNMFGSASKTIRILRVSISAQATAATTVPTSLVFRNTVGTLGSAVLTAAAAVPHDSNNAGATATVNSIGTANYTTVGTIVGTAIRNTNLDVGAIGAVGATDEVYDFTTRNDQGIVLRGVAQQIALNWRGVAVPAGTKLEITVDWTEE